MTTLQTLQNPATVPIASQLLVFTALELPSSMMEPQMITRKHVLDHQKLTLGPENEVAPHHTNAHLLRASAGPKTLSEDTAEKYPKNH